MKIYLAGPIFTYGDLLRNTEWAAKIRAAVPGIDFPLLKTPILMVLKARKNLQVHKRLLMEITSD